MRHAELIDLSLEVAAQHTDDLTPLIYLRFFKLHPETEVEFGIDPDDHSKGKMLVGMLMEIIDQAENNIYPDNIRRLISDHRAYNLVPQMYTDMFDCLRDTVKSLNGDNWNNEIDAAWQAQFDKFMEYVDEAYH